ncbi:MAG: branched-chain amino acid transaminase [Methanomassiliicoccus sp.]|nr:branched-chain amino acid transaminase [Methanomassiliicoccus sp.]
MKKSERENKVWLDGRLTGIQDVRVSPLSYGLHYGWGVYEGLRAYDTTKGRAVFRLRDHMARFLDSARFLQLDVPYSLDELCEAVKEVCRANGPQADYIRPLAFYGENGELALSAVNVPTHVAIMTVHMGAYIRGGAPGASLITSSWERPSNLATSLMAKVCGNYVNSIVAKKEAMRQGADEALMLNHNGSVAEASAENVFMVRHGKLVTPGLSEGILEGITRDTVIELARELGYEVVERSITRGEILIADEVFMTGTAAELHPVRSIDGIPIGKEVPGPVTAELRDLYSKVVRGEIEARTGWLDVIDPTIRGRKK